LSTESATFGTGGAKTMLAALYGELVPHRRSPSLGEPSEDAYSLFYARSAAMGWLTPAVERAWGGLWGTNEAEAGPASGPRPQRVAWFQVVLTGPLPGKLLPVQPFLACAGDVVARLGTLRLDAIQLLLPERDAPEGGQFASESGVRVAEPLLHALNWFTECDPRLQVPVRVTLDGGPDPSIRAAAPAIAQRLQEVRQNVFMYNSYSLADDDHLVLWPAPLDGGRLDFPHHRATFCGTLADWSLDTLGWLAAFLADGSSRTGATTPLIFTADRSGLAGSPADAQDRPR
jgi:hypothetical protein